MSAVRAEATAPTRLYSIGEVIAELRPEFPDVAPSKLRFLESEGLVAPARLPNGYRKYTATHVQRLRVVLTLQRDQYLPLRVIKDKLAELDAGETGRVLDLRDQPDEPPSPPEATAPEPHQRIVELAAVTFAAAAQPPTYGREELLAKSGLSRAAMAEIEDARLVRAQASGRFDEDALMVATVVATLGERGVEVRHIKPIRHTVDREVGNIEVLLAAQRKRRLSGDATDQTNLADAQREIAGGFLALHAALLRQALRSSL